MAFDSTRIVTQMTIKGALPDGRFVDQELLDFAYDCLLSEVVPVVLAAREDFFVRTDDTDIVANQSAYPVPSRALNGVLREVKLVDGYRVIDLDRIDADDVTDLTPGTPNSFYMRGNDVVLHPPPATSQYTLRQTYFIRPSRLVTNAECAQITAIDSATKTVTITIPTGWTASDTFDLVKGRSGFDILALDLTAASVGGGAITFDDALPSTLQVGDWVCLAEETCFPFLPPEGQVALVQCAVTTALEAMGADTAAVSSASKAQSLLGSFQSVLRTRVQGAPKALGKRLL